MAAGRSEQKALPLATFDAPASENRLQGPALYLLDDDLPEPVEINCQAAALAGRVAELDGAITGDPPCSSS